MKILATIGQTLITLCLLAMGGIFLASVAPIPGGFQSKIVQSGSMEPHIPVGAMVVIKSSEVYKVDDVITFGKNAAAIPTTHRIVGTEGSGMREVYTTKGDANEESDVAPVPRAEVIGKVVLSLPYVGFVLDFARQPVGFALLIGLPAALVILEESLSLWAAWRARRTKPKAAPASTQTETPARPAGRLRVSDDMFVHVAPAMRAPRTSSMQGGVVVSALMLVAVFGLGRVGQTISYQNDAEYSIGNTLAAGVWSELVAPEPFVSAFSAPAVLEAAVAPAEEADQKEPEEAEAPQAEEESEVVVVDEPVQEQEPDAAPAEAEETQEVDEPLVEEPLEAVEEVAAPAEPAEEEPVAETPQEEPAS